MASTLIPKESEPVTIEEFWMGRDKKYSGELTEEIKKNGIETVRRVNELAKKAGWKDLIVNSGWRPASVNKANGGALKSKHLTGQAIDLADPSGRIGIWCMDNQNALEEVGLWMESRLDTPTWCHLQTASPRSGDRVFRAK